MKTLLLSLGMLGLVALLPFAPGCAEGDTGFADESTEAAASDAGDEPWAAEDATVSAPADDAGDTVALVIFDDSPSVEHEDASGPAPPTGPPFDAGEAGTCANPPGPGDLIIVELLIESTSGTGDHGEWLEVESTLDCAANLNGLVGQCPSGANVSTFGVEDDVWIPAGGTFVIADSSNPPVNHELPGTVITWSGQPGDVLRNQGATVTLLRGGTIIDSVTYPDRKLTPGVSISFPSDCPASARSDWSAWLDSTRSWFPELLGTPNAPNTDVHCPIAPDD